LDSHNKTQGTSPLLADHVRPPLGSFTGNVNEESSNYDVSRGYPLFAVHQLLGVGSQEQDIPASLKGAAFDLNCLDDDRFEDFDHQTRPFGPLSQNYLISPITDYGSAVESYDGPAGDGLPGQFNSGPSFSGMNWNMALRFPGVNHHAPSVSQPVQSMQTALSATASYNSRVNSFGGFMGGAQPEQHFPTSAYSGFTGNASLPLPSDDDTAPPLALPFQVTQTAAAPAQQRSLVLCSQFPCPMTFKRHADRIRHEAAVHGVNQQLHLCQIPGCPKGQGRGYSRADKLTEHLWKKHGNLGYVKRT